MNTAFISFLLIFTFFLSVEPEEKPRDIVNNTMPEIKDTGD